MQRNPRRIAAVDALKSLAFPAVALFHLVTMLGPRFPAGSPARDLCEFLTPIGGMGTNTFFLLSGMLLCQSLREGSPWSAAVMRRMHRLYPGFVVILGLYLLATPFVADRNKIPADPGEAILFVAANLLLLPGMLPIPPIMTVAWSLSYVVAGYLLIGLCNPMAATGGVLRRCTIWWLVAASLAAAVYWLQLPHDRLVYFPLGAMLGEVASSVWLGSIFPVPRPLEILTSTTGKYSYAVFLTHGLVLHGIRLAQPATESLADLATLLLAAGSLGFICAFGCKTWILDPLQQWLTRRQVPYLGLSLRGKTASEAPAA